MNNSMKMQDSPHEADEAINNDPIDNPKTAEEIKLAEDTRVAASEAKWVEVEELPHYYANTKPPGRKFPASWANDGNNHYIDGDADDIRAPPVEETAEPPKKESRTGVRKQSRPDRKK
ncbi:hypothetical protein E4T42_04734 [Aureobasidium subglaciale]|nr:hypothetical protein E4T42_04734 [Aureobasidium subglaciale]